MAAGRQAWTAANGIEVTVLGGLGEIAAGRLGRLRRRRRGPRRSIPSPPTASCEALEASGSVGRGSGWTPRHLVARSGGAVIAVMPLYAKSHSQGEYIFDHNWAHAWERAGGELLPQAPGGGAVHPGHRPAVPDPPRLRGRGPGRAAAGRAGAGASSRRSRACTSPSAPPRSAPGARRSGCWRAPPSSSTGRTAAMPTSTASSPTSPRASARRSARSAPGRGPSAATSSR